jgi:hypothetical protein
MRRFLPILIVLATLSCSKKSTNPEPRPQPPPPTPKCLVYPTTISLIHSTTDTSFILKNSGETELSGLLSVKNESPQGWHYFFITSPRTYTLQPQDSILAHVHFNPLWRPMGLTMTGTVETGCQYCQDVYLVGE